MYLDVFCGQEIPFIYFGTKHKINANQSTPKLFISVLLGKPLVESKA